MVAAFFSHQTKQTDLNLNTDLSVINSTSHPSPVHTATQKPSASLSFNYCLHTLKSGLLLSSAGRYCSRALVSCSRTWCFSCMHTQTHTHNTDWLFRGSNRGPPGLHDSVYAQGHVAAPCRYTVRHIMKDDDRRVYGGDLRGNNTSTATIHSSTSLI